MLERSLLSKLSSIIDNPDHPLRHLLDRQEPFQTDGQTEIAPLLQRQEIFYTHAFTPYKTVKTCHLF